MACSGDGTAVTSSSRRNRWASRIVSAAMVAIVVVDLLVIQERPGASMAGSHFSITSLASCAPTAASPIVAAVGVSSTMRRVASSAVFPLLGMPIQTRTLIQTMRAAVTSAAAID